MPSPEDPGVEWIGRHPRERSTVVVKPVSWVERQSQREQERDDGLLVVVAQLLECVNQVVGLAPVRLMKEDRLLQ